ncbi:MAG: phytoene/squalene synthase family protein [Janthinobacterium lividum]
MTPMDPALVSAYAYCRTIARREAKNFYYGFLALPEHKRDAMCAVYAFMRRADDIADDESLPVGDRRDMMRTWLQSWHTGEQVLPEDAPVFLAVKHVQANFGVPDDLLEQLVQGTTMDLAPELPPGVRHIAVEGRAIDQYETMQALEKYCYLVASVVGLVTIRIFGYSDPKADVYAEQLGLAFQLTNILRDVKEDAERGRIYLPQELLAKYDLTPTDVLAQSMHSEVGPQMQTLLAEIAIRAQSMYSAADRLIPLLAPDSRAAMRVLIHIYHLLLRRIIGVRYRVFDRRVRVSTRRKVLVLVSGLLRGFLSRTMLRGGSNG